MRARTLSEIPLSLDRDGEHPLSVQLADAIRRLIDADVLAAGDVLPSTRAWSEQLGVSRGTLVTAYDQLVSEGYLAPRQGSGTMVNPRLGSLHPHTARPARASIPVHTPPLVQYDLLPDQPDTGLVNTPAWRAAWRFAAARPLAAAPSEGLAPLREQISEHLRRMRAVVRSPDELLVTSGAREGLTLLLQSLGDPRQLQVGVESPGYPSLRKVVSLLGARIRELSVDASGLRTDQLPEGPAASIPDVVIVTPSHQYPLGGSLPVHRRRALLDWAQRHQVVIVEDDYDSELRYVGQPLPALAALDDPDTGNVVTLGTFSKTIAPDIASGFIIAPRRLREALRRTRAILGNPVSQVTQTALANYLASGELRRHTAQMRRVYRQRRDLVQRALADIPGVTVAPMDGGLHAVVATTHDEADVLAACARRGIRAAALSTYWSAVAARDAQQGVVIGYGHLPEPRLRAALAALADALSECASSDVASAEHRNGNATGTTG